jgi:glycosyltransferase involved in cell wall biosynthesis
LKILLIPSSYFPVFGGLQEAVSQLAMAFKLRGHDVSVLTNRYPRHLKRHEMIDGINVERLLFAGFYLSSLNPYIVLKYIAGLLIGFVNFFRLTLLLKKGKPDVVNIHFLGSQAPFAILASKLLGIRCVVSLHGDDVEGLPHRSKIDHWLFKKVLLAADYVTACSSYLLNEAKKLVPEIESKSAAIWNGINPEEYKNIEPYQHPRPYIFAAGRFVYSKGFDVLLRAFRQLVDEGQNIALILAGDGTERDNLIKLAKELGLLIVMRDPNMELAETNTVLFWGRADRNEMKSLLKGCELVVIPSRKESFGIVALEALATRKKVAASLTVGLEESIGKVDSAYFFKVNDVDDLSEVIRKALISRPSFETVLHTWKDAAGAFGDIFVSLKSDIRIG